MNTWDVYEITNNFDNGSSYHGFQQHDRREKGVSTLEMIKCVFFGESLRRQQRKQELSEAT